MSSETNKAVIRRIFDSILPAASIGNEIEEVIHPDFVDHAPFDPARASGLDSIRATHGALHKLTGGNVRFTIHDIIAEGDKVAVRWTLGPVRSIAWFRLQDGKLIERWAIVEQGAPPG